MALAVLLTAVSCAQEEGPPSISSSDHPHILLISIDTLRADHLASYGYHRETAPALSRLAREGARAARSWSQSPSTVPTHASLFSGLYPFQHRIWWYRDRLPETTQTLAEQLRDHGYRTFCVASSVRFRRESGFDQGCEHYEVVDELPKNERSAKVNRSVLEQATLFDPRPFFGFVHYFDPHEPYAPPEPWSRRWHPGLPEPAPADTSRFLQANREPAQQVSEETLDYLRGLYDAGISYQDAAVADLLRGLADAALAEHVLVIVTSDHGEEFKEHGGLSHTHFLHEELLRVPLLLRWPARIAPGTVLERPVQTVDIYPSVLQLAGLPARPGLAGRSFADLLTGSTAAVRPDPGALDVIVHQQRRETWAVAATLASGRFKLVVHLNGSPQLFDLDRDPGGHHDVGVRFPAELAAMLDLAAELGIEAAPADRPPPGLVVPSEELAERLRAIGYLDEAEGR